MACDDLFIDIDKLPSSLSKSESVELLIKIKNGDMEARRIFIEHNIRLVLYEVTNKFYNAYNDLRELVSCGVVGLVKAVDNFDLSKKVEFSTFAIKCIDNEILRFLKYNNNSEITSLDDFVFNFGSGDKYKIIDVISDDVDIERDYLKEEVLSVVRKVIGDFSKRDREIINMYFGFGYRMHSQYEIARELGVSQNLISMRMIKMMKKFRIALKNLDFIDFYVTERHGKNGKRNRVRKKEVKD